MNLFREFYAISELSEKDQIKYWLTRRYTDKASDRLKREADTLFENGDKISDETMKKIFINFYNKTKAISAPRD